MVFGGALLFVMIAFWLWALYDVATTPAAAVRSLPKVVWLAVVFVTFGLGAFAWAAFGRPHPDAPPAPPSRWRPDVDNRVGTQESDRERIERERREYYSRMDEELDRRLAEKQRTAPDDGDAAPSR